MALSNIKQGHSFDIDLKPFIRKEYFVHEDVTKVFAGKNNWELKQEIQQRKLWSRR